MKAKLLLLLTLLFTGCGAAEQPKAGFDIASLQGQWLVINYWAKWCGPCIEEIPELNALDSKFADVTVVGVNYDGAQGDDLHQQAAAMGITFTLADTDPAQDLGYQRPVVLPTTLVFSPDGQLHTTLIGPQTLDELTKATGHERQ